MAASAQAVSRWRFHPASGPDPTGKIDCFGFVLVAAAQPVSPQAVAMSVSLTMP
jgi:hypothetical protein